MLSGASTQGVSSSAQHPVRQERARDVGPRDRAMATMPREPGFSLVEVSSATFIDALAVFLGEPRVQLRCCRLHSLRCRC